MNQPTSNDNRDFAAHWRKTGAMLANVRRRELREFDHQASAEVIDSLLQLGMDFSQKRTTSGLVEWQRRLRRGRS